MKSRESIKHDPRPLNETAAHRVAKTGVAEREKPSCYTWLKQTASSGSSAMPSKAKKEPDMDEVERIKLTKLTSKGG